MVSDFPRTLCLLRQEKKISQRKAAGQRQSLRQPLVIIAVDCHHFLEKLLFLWQDATSIREEGENISVWEDLHSESGFAFSRLVIGEEKEEND